MDAGDESQAGRDGSSSSIIREDEVEEQDTCSGVQKTQGLLIH